MTVERPGVRLSRVTHRYRRRTALDAVDLELGVGVTAMLGPNGAGKTTLLRIAATAITPTSGRVHLGGVVVDGGRATRQARRQVGYLPQGFGADPRFTVRDLVAYAAWLRQVPTEQVAGAVGEAVAHVGLQDRADSRLGALSGGMRQRAGLAAAVVGRPSVVLLDEPTVGLDPQQRLEFRELVRSLSDRCVLLSTHLVEDVTAVADRIVILAGGTIRFDGTRDDLAGSVGAAPSTAGLEQAYLRAVGTQS